MKKSLKELWNVFGCGDPITDEELNTLIVSAQSGIEYLEARGEKFVLFKTILDLETLKGFQNARKRR